MNKRSSVCTQPISRSTSTQTGGENDSPICINLLLRTKAKGWRGRTSPKCPISCRMEWKTSTHSINQVSTDFFSVGNSSTFMQLRALSLQIKLGSVQIGSQLRHFLLRLPELWCQADSLVLCHNTTRWHVQLYTWHTVNSKRYFSTAAPSAWNSLPVSVQNCDMLTLFKSRLKAHLFSSVYAS